MIVFKQNKIGIWALGECCVLQLKKGDTSKFAIPYAERNFLMIQPKIIAKTMEFAQGKTPENARRKGPGTGD